jgi:diguanylate cyclase (GGDEF)-like protein
VIDRTPRVFTGQHRRWLRLFAGLVEREADIRQRLARCPVTGLFNRATVLTLAQKEFERSRRTGGTMALLVLQLLNAGQIRAAADPCDADQPLRDLATGLTGLCRPADLVGRLAEEVFALLLVEPADDRVAALVERLQAGADSGGLLPGFPWPARFAIGSTRLAADDLSAADLIIRADNALLLAAGGDSDMHVTVLGD